MTASGSKNDKSQHRQNESKLSNEDRARLQQMLNVLRATEARHKKKSQRDATFGMGDRVCILSGPHSNTNAVICDMDYINSVALVELDDDASKEWLKLSVLAHIEAE